MKAISVGALLPAPQRTIMSSVPPNVKVKEGSVAVENAVNPVESTSDIAIFYFFSIASLILSFAESIKN